MAKDPKESKCNCVGENPKCQWGHWPLLLVGENVATLALARDQGKGVARCKPNSRPGSAIEWEENSKCQWGHWPLLLVGESVATLAFGLRPRQGGCEVAGLEVDPGVTSHAPGSSKSATSVREWTLTLPSELPHWELVRVESQKDSQNFRERFEGSKLHGWLRSLYQWKALEV
jgi:hypothetical protein